MKQLALLTTGIIALLLLGACAGDPIAAINPLASHSELTIAPMRGPDQPLAFNAAYYSFDQRNDLTIVLLAGDERRPKAVVTIRLFWRPQVGATPVDRTATNTTIRYILLEQTGQPTAAVYSGAGFLKPYTSKGQETFRGDLVEANLRLVDAPESFHDDLGLINLAGRVTAVRDDVRTGRLLRLLQQQLTERLGYPRLVLR